MTISRGRSKEPLFAGLFSLLFLSVFYWTTESHVRPITCSNESCAVMDFAYYMAFDGAALLRPEVAPYSLDGNKAFIAELFGFSPQNGMPIGLAPVAIFILAPFGLMFREDPLLAYRVFVSIGISALWLAVTLVLTERVPQLGITRRSIVATFMTLALLLTPAGHMAATHGQLSLLALAGILILSLGSLPRWIRVGTAVLLCCKPTYALLGFAVLLCQWRRTEFFLAAGIVTSLSILTLPLIGVRGWIDYVGALGVFAGGERPAFYEAAFGSGEGTTLSYVLAQFMSASAVERAMVYVRLAVVGGGALAIYKNTSWPLYLLATLAILVLTLPPYLGRYEDLLIVGVPFLLSSTVAGRVLPSFWILVAALIMTLGVPVLGAPLGLLLATLFKVGVIGVCMVVMQRRCAEYVRTF